MVPDDESQMMRGRMVNSMDYLFTAGLLFLGAVLFSSVCLAAEHQRDVVKASVAVDARANSSSGGQGKDTGIDVAKSDVLIVNVDPNDNWSAGSDQPCTRKSNADGLTKCYAPYSSSNLSANYGSLVGRIGDGPFFLIGTSYENEVTVSGRLRLYYWDSNSGDNSGFITANLVAKRRSTITPQLTGVEIVDPDTLDPIDEVAIGQSFRVRLTFAEDPGTEVTETVTIRTSDGSAQFVLVTGNSRVIVSEPILVAPAGR